MSFVYNWMNERLLETVTDLSRKAKHRVLVVSPYVGYDPWKAFDENIRSIEDTRFVIDFSKANVASGGTDPRGVEQLSEIGSVRRAELARKLHAKVYIIDNTAIIGSPNLSLAAMGKNIETAIVTKNIDLVKHISRFFEKLWESAKPVTWPEITQMKAYWKRYRRERKKSPFVNDREIAPPRYRGSKWTRPVIPSGRGGHILLYVNWSPHGYSKPCTYEQRGSKTQHACCIESTQCYRERHRSWRNGCASSRVFKTYEYATRSKRAIKKRRLVFLVARNPNIGCDYYVCGFLYVIDAVPGRSKLHPIKTSQWGKTTVYWFKASHSKSVRLPIKDRGVVRFDRALVDRLSSLRIDWSREMKREYKEPSRIGLFTRMKYIPEEDAITLLEECYEKTKDSRIAGILADDFAMKIS